MVFCTQDNQPGQFERPSPEVIDQEWRQQLLSYQELRRVVLGIGRGLVPMAPREHSQTGGWGTS